MRKWIIGALAAVVLAGAAAIGLWLSAGPEPLTGDREADAACAAFVGPLVGPQGPSELALMSPDERRAWVREVVGHASKADIPAIRDASDSMAAAQGMDSAIGLLTAAPEMTAACRGAGWNAQEAGIEFEFE